MWTKTADGSIVDNSERVIYFSMERFWSDICEGDCCFICGASPESKAFSHEHVFPKWVLRRFKLFSEKIKLTNSVPFQYDRYKVQCCIECNEMMGDLVENPVAKIVLGGKLAVDEFVENGGLLKIFVWMGLIFLKVHLRDRFFRQSRDLRENERKIGDLHSWDDLHHLHCIVRCFYNDCEVESGAIGSFLSLPARCEVSPDTFDFADFSFQQTMLLRFDDLGLLTVFDDSGAAMAFFCRHLEKITGAVSELQLREIMVELALLNQHLKQRPTFYSEFDMANERYCIRAKRPPMPQLVEMDYSVRGNLLKHALGYALPHLRVEGYTTQEIRDAIESGAFSVLFDDNGKFIEKSMVLKD